MAIPDDQVRYPRIRQRLLELAAEDQNDRQPGKFYGDKPGELPARSVIEAGIRRDRARADELLVFLKHIKVPSVRNIGYDGSRAAWLIAQHNPEYKNLGPVMLRKMKYLYYKDKNQVHYKGIPYLVDRLMIIRQKYHRDAKQLYGTQGYVDENGTLHSYPVIDAGHVHDRLMKFDLDLRACIKPNTGQHIHE